MSTHELSRSKAALDKSNAGLALEFGHAWDYAPSPEARDHVHLQPRYDLFVNGRWTAPKSGKYFLTVSPSTEEPLAEVAEASAEDVDLAVKAATELPSDLLLAHVPLADFSETNLAFTLSGTAGTVSVADKLNWLDGAVAEKGYSVRAATTPQFADIGDFDRDQAMTYAAWVKLSGARDGAVIARMDDAFVAASP